MNIKKEYIYQSPSSKSNSNLLLEKKNLPLVVLPKLVLFPNSSIALASLSLKKVDELVKIHKDSKGLAITTGLSDDKDLKDLKGKISNFGTEAFISGVIKLENGEVGLILKGLHRLFIQKVTSVNDSHYACVEIIKEEIPKQTTRFLAEARALKDLVKKLININPNVSQEVTNALKEDSNPQLLCDSIAPHLSFSLEESLSLLCEPNLRSRIDKVIKKLSQDIKLLTLSSKIQKGVQEDLKENIKRNFLHEQLAAIKKELGNLDEEQDEVEELYKSIEQLKLPKQTADVAFKELERMELMGPNSPEYMTAWTYVNWIKDLPWNEKSEDKKIPTLLGAKKIIDTSHHGLDKVKERILEHIAVLKHKGSVSGSQILLLVGPPGVGKTSLVKTIAKSLNRPFAKVSLGGVNDEAEIRGHRRTYIAAMPGKIIQALKAAGSKQAVILLDEIDKTSGSTRGTQDISSALLEVLDAEQNKEFTDHYLSIPFDLSNIIFVATANSLHNISEPLLDRMEVIELAGYTANEKIHIAQKHLIPKIRKDLNLASKNLNISSTTLSSIINHYTRESGVRQLQRELSTIGRKIVKNIVLKKKTSSSISLDSVIKFLGPPHFLDEPKDKNLTPGVSIGLAYTRFGGDILYIESKMTPSKSKGRLSLTGSLGKVMQESAQTCMVYLGSHAKDLNFNVDILDKNDIHIHFPDGATPKDGPSAGVTILCALMSLITSQTIPSDFAMTGEISLRGQVLPVGGIKEKILAAHRYGKKRIILPVSNWLDLDSLPKEILEDLKLYPVKNMMDVLIITSLVKGKKIAPKKYQSFKTQKKNKTNIFQVSSIF